VALIADAVHSGDRAVDERRRGLADGAVLFDQRELDVAARERALDGTTERLLTLGPAPTGDLRGGEQSARDRRAARRAPQLRRAVLAHDDQDFDEATRAPHDLGKRPEAGRACPDEQLTGDARHRVADVALHVVRLGDVVDAGDWRDQTTAEAIDMLERRETRADRGRRSRVTSAPRVDHHATNSCGAERVR